MTLRRTDRWTHLVDLVTEPFLIVAVVHASILALRLPLFDRLPGWMFSMHGKALGPAWLIGALAVLIAASGWLVLSQRQPDAIAVAILIATGYLFQQGLAWSEGRGINGMRDRMVTSGHAEFATVAVQQRSVWSVLTRYESKVQGGELLRYAHSKPPGQLAFYMLTERLGGWFTSDHGADARLASLRTTAAILWPLLAYVALIPLYATVRMLDGSETAQLASLLYLVIPATALITLHTDQVLFPALSASVVWIAVVAAKRSSLWWSIAAGIALYLCAFFTFALLLTLPIAWLSAWAVNETASANGLDRRAIRRFAIVPVGTAIGFALCFGVFATVLDYDFFRRFSDARNFNATWKGWEGGAFQTVYWAWTNALEYVLWVGVPVALLAAGSVQRALRATVRGSGEGLTLTAISVAMVLAYLAFFGQSKAESARLWLFLTPWVCACAAAEVRTRFSDNRGLAIATIVSLQWLTVVLTKANQDFW